MKTTMEKKQSRADDGAGNQTASRLPLSKRPKVDGLGLASKHFTSESHLGGSPQTFLSISYYRKTLALGELQKSSQATNPSRLKIQWTPTRYVTVVQMNYSSLQNLQPPPECL